VTDGQTDRQTDILIALSAALHYMRCCAAKSDAEMQRASSNLLAFNKNILKLYDDDDNALCFTVAV